MQLQMTVDTSQSSSDSDSSIKMTLGSPSSPNKIRGTFTLSSATMDPLTSFDSWPTSTGLNPKAIGGVAGVGRGRLPSIGESNPASKLNFPAQQSFMQMFTTPGTNGSIYSKRKNLYAGYQQQNPNGSRPVKDRIIKHSQSETQNKSKVEPLPEDADDTNIPHSLLQGNAILDSTGIKKVWTAPSDMVKGPRNVATLTTKSPPSNLTAHREMVTIDGKVRRVRFLSADHTPLREDPEFKKLLSNTKTVVDTSRKGVVTERNSRTKVAEDKKVPLRSVTVAGVRKTGFDGGGGGKAAPKTDSKQESPDVWLERARKLRASKDKNVTKTESISRQSESVKFHEDEENNLNKEEDKVLTSGIKHVNYCDEKKTRWVVKWLEDVNKQSHFDIIE